MQGEEVQGEAKGQQGVKEAQVQQGVKEAQVTEEIQHEEEGEEGEEKKVIAIATKVLPKVRPPMIWGLIFVLHHRCFPSSFVLTGEISRRFVK